MKKSKRIFTALLLAALLVSALCVPASALTESEVESVIETSGEGAVTGNVLIWFFCALAFLKVSQKIDSLMAALGINVSRPGGSLLAEAMVAMRAVTMVVNGGRRAMAGRAGSASGSTVGESGSAGMSGFFKGGLIGMADRQVTNNAVKTAATQTSAVHTAQSQAYQTTAAAAETASDAHINNEVHTGGTSIHTDNTVPTGTPPQDGVIVTDDGVSTPAAAIENAPSVGPVPDETLPQEGVILNGSEALITIPADLAPQMESASADMIPPEGSITVTSGDATIHTSTTENTTFGGPADAAVISSEQVHTEREQSSHTSVSSEKMQISHSHSSDTRPTLGGMVFSRSLEVGGSFANDVIGTVARGEVSGSITGEMAAQSLQSYLGYTAQGSPPPIFTDTEIGSGKITGQVSTPEHPQPTAFGLYHAEQYAEPKGAYTKIRSMDGTLWYSQLARDTVVRKPHQAPDGTVTYHEEIIKKLPDPPKRKGKK